MSATEPPPTPHSAMKGSNMKQSPSGRRVRISTDEQTPSPNVRSDEKRPVFHLGDSRRSLTASDAEDDITRLNALMEAKARNKEMHEKLKLRRTSLPASAFSMANSKPKNLSSSNLAEARGIIADMLAERDIPSQVASGLRAVSSLLQPPPTHSWTSHDFGLPNVVEDPLSGDSIQVQNNSKKADYFVFTTVTSATGLPAWEPGPSKARSNSSYWKPEDSSSSAANGGVTIKEEKTERSKIKQEKEEEQAVEKETVKIAPNPCSSSSAAANHVASVPIQKKTEDSEVSSTSSSWALVNGDSPHMRDTPPLSEYLFDEEAVVYLRDGCEMRIKEMERDAYLARISEWGLPIFEMSDRHPQAVLSRMAYGIFKSMDLFKTFKIDMNKFFSFFHALECGYHEIPYHNRIHAADVLHAVYYLVVHPVQPFQFTEADDDSTDGAPATGKSTTVSSNLPATILQKVRSGMAANANGANGPSSSNGHSESASTVPAVPCAYREKKERPNSVSEDVVKAPLHSSMTTLELLALFTAAAMHDYDHPGRTNAFLVATVDKKAILYNDRSVLENHHAAESWKLLQQPKNNFIENLDAAETRRFRYLVLEYILATDLKQHFEIIMNFTDKLQMSEARLTNEPDRVMVSRMLIKLADVNSPAKPFGLHRQWTERICSEFYLQGDEEKELDMKVTAYMDRNCPEVAKLQHSFISHLVAPLIDTMNTAGILPILPGLPEPEIMMNLKCNLEKWTRICIDEGDIPAEEEVVEDTVREEDEEQEPEPEPQPVPEPARVSVQIPEPENPVEVAGLNANSKEDEYI